MYSRLKFLSLISVSVMLSLSIPVYGETPSPTPRNSIAQNSTTEADKLFEQGVQLYRRGQYFQALPVLQKVLEVRRQQNNKAEIARTLNNIGEVYIRLEENDNANQFLQSALTIRRELKDVKGEGETLDNIGLVYFGKKEYDKALELLQQALVIRRRVNDRKGEAKTLANIGIVYSFGFDKNGEALKFLEQAFRIQEEVGDKYQAGFTLNHLAQVYIVLNQYPRAFEVLEKAKLINSQIDNPIAKVKRIAVLSWLYFRQQDKQRAIELGEQALALARTNNMRLEELRRLNWLLNVYSITKISPSRLIEYAKTALSLAKELKQRKSEAEALNTLGRSYTLLEEYETAIDFLQTSAMIAREIKDLNTESLALTHLSFIYTLQAKNDKVIEISLRELEISRLQKDLLSEVGTLIYLSSTYNATGKHEKALETNQQALAVLQKIDVNTLSPIQKDVFFVYQFNALDLLSTTYASLGKYNQALDAAQKALAKAQSLQKPEFEVQALLHLAFLYDNGFQNLPKAIEFSQLALKIAQQIKQPEIEVKVLNNLSDIYQKQKNYSLALETSQKALIIARQLKDAQLEYSSLENLSDIYRNQGNYQKALEFAQQSYDVLEKAGLTNFKTLAINSLSQNYLLLGNTVKAEETAKQAIALSQTNNNKYGETVSLAHLTQAYIYQGKYEQGIEVAKQGLAITKKMKNFQGEVTFSTGLSEMYEALGNYGKVISVAQPNLELARKIRKRDDEARLLINLGNAYRVVGEYSKGKDSIEQGLKIARELKSPILELNALNNLGYYYASLKDYQKALELTKASLKIAQKLESPVFLISPQFNLGDIYSNLGDYQKSRDYYQQALTTAQKLKNRRGEGIALLSLANTHFAQGEPQKTVELSQQALTIFQEIKVPQLQAFAHRMLSTGYGELSNDANAMNSAQKFLEFARKVENPVFEKSALNRLGDLHHNFGRNQEAIKAYQQAIAIQTPENITGSNWGIYAGLGRVYRKLNQSNVAIGYYKQAINGIEEIRRGIEGLPPELQNSFLDTVVDFQGTKTADIYRELAELLISQARQAEARQVIDLLKIQEIRDFAEGKTDVRKPEVDLTDAEEKIKTKSESIIALSKQISECEKTDCKEKSQLYDKRTALLIKFDKDLKEIDKEIRDRTAKDDIFPPNRRGRVADIVKAQPNTVMVYPFVLEDKLWLLLYSGDVAKKFEVKVSRSELGNTVKQFRDLMEECETRAYCGAEDIAKIKPVSQKLYNWLIKPLEAELKQNKVKNLVFALDRVTRYVPMSALYDGKQYLIENYTIYNVLSADLTDTNSRLPAKVGDTKVLAMGVSDAVGGFPALNNVPKEVDNIVRSSSKDKGIYPGKEYLNKSFNSQTLSENLGYKNHNILHLATHGKFVPGREEASYLLLGNGEKLAIPKIKTLVDLNNIHLVVLSACQTALAAPRQDGVEIASLAYSFLNTGAKSVIASLWQVADSSTSDLMQNFYSNLAKNKQKITKAEAMRLAQLQLLYNKDVTVSDIKRSGGLIPEQIPSSTKKSESKTFAHPYYWAPFVLIGNGL